MRPAALDSRLVWKVVAAHCLSDSSLQGAFDRVAREVVGPGGIPGAEKDFRFS